MARNMTLGTVVVLAALCVPVQAVSKSVSRERAATARFSAHDPPPGMPPEGLIALTSGAVLDGFPRTGSAPSDSNRRSRQMPERLVDAWDVSIKADLVGCDGEITQVTLLDQVLIDVIKDGSVAEGPMNLVDADRVLAYQFSRAGAFRVAARQPSGQALRSRKASSRSSVMLAEFGAVVLRDPGVLAWGVQERDGLESIVVLSTGARERRPLPVRFGELDVRVLVVPAASRLMVSSCGSI